MRHNDILDTLQNLTNKEVKQRELAEALKCKIGTIGKRAVRNSDYSLEEVLLLNEAFGVDLINKTVTREEKIIADITHTNGGCPYRMEHNCPCREQFEIKYMDELPEEARLPEITSVHVDMQLVVNHWQRKPENLRIIPMQGDNLSSYFYPIKNRDILIVDIESTIATREGLYVYSAHNNTMLFVGKLWQGMDGTIKIERFEANGEVTEKFITPEKQKEVDFKILARVVKNASLSL